MAHRTYRTYPELPPAEQLRRKTFINAREAIAILGIIRSTFYTRLDKNIYPKPDFISGSRHLWRTEKLLKAENARKRGRLKKYAAKIQKERNNE